jgi:hypothetical protein
MYCIACQEPVQAVAIFDGGKDAPFCNNGACPRFGLISIITTPEPAKKDEKENKEDKHKKV